MRRASIAVAALLALAACGRGQSPVVEGAGVTSSTVAVVAGDTTAPADPTATTAAAAGVPGAAPVDPATVETTPPADPEAPPPEADPGFLPPALGRYTFRTTGTLPPPDLLSPPQAIDEQTVTIISSLGGGDIRQAAEDGSQIVDLRYQDDGVFVRLLELAMQGVRFRFRSPDGVLFTPVPPTAGQAWNWQLTDDTGQLTAAWSATTQPSQVITAVGASIEAAVVDAVITLSGTYSGFQVAGTMHLTLWLDPDRRTAVQLHQVTDITQPIVAHGDTTSVLTGFAPA